MRLKISKLRYHLPSSGACAIFRRQEKRGCARAEQFDEILDAIAFGGDTLAPFFLEDPKTGGAQASFSAFASLDADAAAREWPFAETASSAHALREMV